EINENFSIKTENQQYYPLSASIRVIIPQILASQTEKILYIDCDTLIVNNLQPLFNQKTESIITVSHDIDYERHIKRISLENKSYFNSGVILINTKRWVDKQITEKTLELLN